MARHMTFATAKHLLLAHPHGRRSGPLAARRYKQAASRSVPSVSRTDPNGWWV